MPKSSETTKQALIKDFINQLKAHRESCNKTSSDMKNNDLGEFLLSEHFLKNHSELMDFDCSGRGLPAENYAKLHHYWGFSLDKNIEKVMTEKELFSEYLKDGK